MKDSFAQLLKICSKQSAADSIINSELEIIKTAKNLGYEYDYDYEYIGEDQGETFLDGVILKNKRDHFLRITRIFRSTKYEIDNDKTRFCIGCDNTDEVLEFLRKYINY